MGSDSALLQSGYLCCEFGQVLELYGEPDDDGHAANLALTSSRGSRVSDVCELTIEYRALSLISAATADTRGLSLNRAEKWCLRG